MTEDLSDSSMTWTEPIRNRGSASHTFPSGWNNMCFTGSNNYTEDASSDCRIHGNYLEDNLSSVKVFQES